MYRPCGTFYSIVATSKGIDMVLVLDGGSKHGAHGIGLRRCKKNVLEECSQSSEDPHVVVYNVCNVISS